LVFGGGVAALLVTSDKITENRAFPLSCFDQMMVIARIEMIKSLCWGKSKRNQTSEALKHNKPQREAEGKPG